MISTENAQRVTLLSPHFSLPPLEEILGPDPDISNTEINQLVNEELHVLSDLDGKFFLINPTIKAFLESFKEPKTLDEVIGEFAVKGNCSADQIQDVMHSFYKDMYKEGIIISKESLAEYQRMMQEESINSAKYAKGDHIGRYEVKDELVIRNASQLYLAHDPLTEESVVIKTMIYPDFIPEKVKSRSWRKFVQEFELMQSLGDHPHICKLIELNQSDVNPFAAIEHIKGVSLRAYIADNEIQIVEKVRLIKQLLSAIDHVQSKKVVHGDIHLSNFLVNNEKQIKLIDFGLSNNAEMKDGEIKRNGGVYYCIPPERVKLGPFSFLSQRADFRSEVFQLAVICYYVLYEDYPFSGFTWKDLGQNILNQEVQLNSYTPNNEIIPEKILDTLRKAFQKDPDNRFPDAKSMINFLDK